MCIFFIVKETLPLPPPPPFPPITILLPHNSKFLSYMALGKPFNFCILYLHCQFTSECCGLLNYSANMELSKRESWHIS